MPRSAGSSRRSWRSSRTRRPRQLSATRFSASWRRSISSPTSGSPASIASSRPSKTSKRSSRACAEPRRPRAHEKSPGIYRVSRVFFFHRCAFRGKPHYTDVYYFRKSLMKIPRYFTTVGKSPYDGIEFEPRRSEIRNPDGSTVFLKEDVMVPSSWSQVATDILAQKYFRRAGVPQSDGSDGGEGDARQVFHRLAGCWRHWGEGHGYFETKEDGQAFYDELCHMLAKQIAAPNSPQWFNTGLHFAYGIAGVPQGHYYVDPKTGEVAKSTNAYERPQPHACFILSVNDDLVNEGGIMDLWTREARIFKYGSGVGTNFSKIRGENEKLSGGGKSSGLMSFLRVGDRSAGAIKSGGTTRRAAKMDCLDLDHPDIEEFVGWKVKEEQKVAALVTGSKICEKRLNAVMRACRAGESDGAPILNCDPRKNPQLNKAVA